LLNHKVIAILVLICFGSVAGAAPARKKTSSQKASTVKATGKKAAASGGRRRATKASPQALARARKPVRVTQQAPSLERYTEIQQALAAKGYYSGPVNGAWGSDSVDALKRFQQDQNLNPDGKLGALSIIALGLGPKRDPASALAGKPQPPPE
jgi:peptidoglycan hydrolase-like protein with peptidoglycan-binding domain